MTKVADCKLSTGEVAGARQHYCSWFQEAVVALTALMAAAPAPMRSHLAQLMDTGAISTCPWPVLRHRMAQSDVLQHPACAAARTAMGALDAALQGTFRPPLQAPHKTPRAAHAAGQAVAAADADGAAAALLEVCLPRLEDWHGCVRRLTTTCTHSKFCNSIVHPLCIAMYRKRRQNSRLDPASANARILSSMHHGLQAPPHGLPPHHSTPQCSLSASALAGLGTLQP